MDKNNLDGIVQVYNNLGDHWIKVYPQSVPLTEDYTDRLHRVATWYVKLKELPSNAPYKTVFYDAASFSPTAYDLAWRFPNV
jgi:hypothetical protein